MSAAAPDLRPAGAALEVEGVEAGYGEARVLHGVSLRVRAGSIAAVLGSNGAGKTTLMRLIAGLLRPRIGRLVYAGDDATHLSASARVAAGIALVPEGRLVFADFSVEENLLVGAFSRRARAGRKAMLEELYARYPVLRERRRQLGGTLSGGQQQMLAIGRGLMSRPRLLLLDEPSLGLAPRAVGEMFEMVQQIRATGTTILLVEQNARRSLEIADDAFVLETGTLAIAGTAASLLNDDRVRRAYLGL